MIKIFGAVNLIPFTLISRGEYMDMIMARAAKRLAISDLITKLRVVTPRLRMVDYSSFRGQFLSARLAYKFISSHAIITPLIIKHRVPMGIERVGFISFGESLLRGRRFVRTVGRAEASLSGVILMTPKRLSTFFAVLVKSSLLHQYDINTMNSLVAI